jgi:SagB-type dehydrogenase family enzyme
VRRWRGIRQLLRRARPDDDGPQDGAVAAVGLETAQLRGAVYVNAFRPLQPSFRSTGLRTHPLRYDALHQADTRVAEEFLVNSRLRRGDVEFEASVGSYFTEPTMSALPLVGQEGRKGVRGIELPPALPLALGLSDTVARRRSVRTYTGEAMSLAYLGTILRLAGGITGSGGPHGEIAFRAAPSGGGLYPIDIHVGALRINGLARGLYVYDPRADLLWHRGSEAVVEAVLAATAAPDQVIMTSAATAIVLLVGRPWRAMRKYGPRAMRHVFLEAGAIAEHINLAAAALGIGAVDSSSFYDDEVHEALGLDGVYEALVHGQVLGIPG